MFSEFTFFVGQQFLDGKWLGGFCDIYPRCNNRAHSGEVGHRFRWMWSGVGESNAGGKIIIDQVEHFSQEKCV